MGKGNYKAGVVVAVALVSLGVAQLFSYNSCMTAKQKLEQVEGYGDFPTGLIAEGKQVQPVHDSVLVVPVHNGGSSDRFLMDIPSDAKGVIITYPAYGVELDSRFLIEVPDMYKKGITKTPKMDLIYESKTNKSDNKVGLGVV